MQKDPASLHASICVAASSTALQTGEFPLIDPTKQTSSVLVLDTFHHRGETIRLVNEGLSDPIKAASDELIAAVSILLTIEVCVYTVQRLNIGEYLTALDCIGESGLSQDPPRRITTDDLLAK